MLHKQVAHQPKTFVLIFETGDEIMACLNRFAGEQNLSGSSFVAIGALSGVKLSWFDWEAKQFVTSVDLDEQVELLSLIGDVAMNDGEHAVHAHVVVGCRDGSTRGGHLVEGHVRPTCELVLTETPEHLQKRIDTESGLALIRM